jgi:Flp pilus assembly CpaE family ATPase
MPSLKATRRCLDLFDKLGVSQRRVRLILNYSAMHSMDVESAAAVLGRNPDFVLKKSDALDQAITSGRPLVTSDPGDPLVADLRKLSDAIVASVSSAVERVAD